MSTRWYPIYQKGNPQLRIFLPNFWMKMVKPEQHSPTNIVTFHCSLQMTRIDVKNYLEKIYKIPVMKVNTRIAIGKTKRDQVCGYVTKEDDIKIAYVHLPKDQEFVFPNLFENEKQKKETVIRENNLKEMKQEHKRFLDKNRYCQGTPGWFNL